ncbi:MAG TPA: biotin-dependent carboxyltransferase family protein [Candidatus Limnocylindria bacterium]|nr:biotin-dependent carboxyltransferase family protein [Candidatus Limnocylindria bacterium]
MRATVQDRGRPAGARLGVPPSGPADPTAFAAALALCGCDPDQAAIEVIGLPFAFRCSDRRIVAATGRDVRIRTRAANVGWTSVLARPGEEVVVDGSPRTRFAYVAISGGIDLPLVQGSRATYLPAALGPFPRALAAGDELPLGSSTTGGAGMEVAGRTIAPPGYDGPVRAIAGPHEDRFDRDSVDRFFASAYVVLAESDRMGVRLDGPAVPPLAGELLTCGIVAGAIQVPRGGAPIVLLADHQTTGGYPIIGTVVTRDVGRVAQAAPGEQLRFSRVTLGASGRSP